MPLVMERLVLDDAVGMGCKNARADVLRVQFALNTISPLWGGPTAELPFDGIYEKRIGAALQSFQLHCFSKARKPTGKIAPSDPTHGKINQVLAGGVDIVAVTSHGGKAVEKGADAFTTEIRFDGLTDLVTKVTAALGKDPGKKIAHLSISSHGASGYMALSSTSAAEDLCLAQVQNQDMTNYRPDQLAYDQEAILGRLKGKFMRSGVVTLSACHVSDKRIKIDKTTKKELYNVDGRNFLKAVSRALGNVAVQGGTEKQFDSDYGMEGPCYRCDSHFCTIITPKVTTFFGPEFSFLDEFGQHALDDALAEDTLAAVANLPMEHPDKQGLLKKLFRRGRR